MSASMSARKALQVPAPPRAAKREQAEGTHTEPDHRPERHAPGIGSAGPGHVRPQQPIDAQIDPRRILERRGECDGEDDDRECVNQAGPMAHCMDGEGGCQEYEQERRVGLHGQRAGQERAQRTQAAGPSEEHGETQRDRDEGGQERRRLESRPTCRHGHVGAPGRTALSCRRSAAGCGSDHLIGAHGFCPFGARVAPDDGAIDVPRQVARQMKWRTSCHSPALCSSSSVLS